MDRENIKFLDDEENDVDLYDFNATEQVGQQLREAVKTSYGKSSHGGQPPRAGGASRAGRGVRGMGGGGELVHPPPSSIGRIGTAGAGLDAAVRPMTAVRAAGYSSLKESAAVRGLAGGTGAGLAGSGPSAGSLKLAEGEETPEDRIRLLESKVMARLQESYLAAAADMRGQSGAAQESASLAAVRELEKLERERATLLPESTPNVDLGFSVKLNRAVLLHKADKLEAARQTYGEIINSKAFLDPIIKRFNVNVGNMSVKSRVYSDKEFKKALDNTPQTHKLLKCKINMNRAVVLMKKRQYEEAAAILEEQVLASKETSFDVRAAYNLVMCRYMCGDRLGMKAAFERLLRLDLNLTPPDTYEKQQQPAAAAAADHNDTKWNEVVDAMRGDRLHQYEKQKRERADHLVTRAAKLIAPCIEPDFSSGFDWIVEQMKGVDQYKHLQNEMQITKAISYVKLKRFDQAIHTLKQFANKGRGSDIAGSASTNLAAIFFLQNDLAQAQKYATVAVQLDPYNAQAFNNKGCVLLREGQYSNAYQFFSQATRNDSTCMEAVYNLGLAAKLQGQYEEARATFEQLHAILRTNAEVQYQLAELCERMDDLDMAKHWLEMVAVTSGRHDPGLFSQLGAILETAEDENEAFKMYSEAFKCLPSSSAIVKWLGSYYVRIQVYEKAIVYFEKAAVAQPANPVWPHHIAKCYRRIGNYQRAFETYRLIHRRFPDNIECLEALVQLSGDLGLGREQEDFSKELRRVQKSAELRDQRVSSGRKSSAAAARHDSPGVQSRTGSGGTLGGGGRSLPTDALAYLDSTTAHDDMSAAAAASDIGEAHLNYQERPKTAARRPGARGEDEFGDEQLGDDLLPE